MKGNVDVGGLSRRIERRIESRQRTRKTLNFVLCAVVLVLGTAALLMMMARWFIVF